MNRSPRRMLAVALGALLLGGCRPKPESQPGPPAASAALPLASTSAAPLASASAAPGPSASAPRALAEVPELTTEPLAGPARKQPRGLGTIEGAVVLWEGPRLGRLTAGGVEWLARKIPPGGPLGDTLISQANGRWPDEIGVFFYNAVERAPEPSYFPLTGKGSAKAIGGGGVPAFFRGVARLGETTLVSFEELAPSGSQIVHVRGPFLSRLPITPKKAGCTPEESTPTEGRPAEKFAVNPAVFGATRDGTLLSVGSFCLQRGVAAEVWDKSTKGARTAPSRIIDLSALFHELRYSPELLQGTGDEAWFFVSDKKSPIVQYKDGEFTALAPTPTPAVTAFVSLSGQLHASDGRVVYRYEDRAWRPVARFAWPLELRAMALDGEAMWADVEGEILRLRPGPSLAVTAGCPTPFVYLYSPSAETPKNHAFPAMSKAIAGFEGSEGLAMTDFSQAGSRRLGVAVSSLAQGEALLAHLRTTMKDESPQLICFEPPQGARLIPVVPKKK